MHVAQIILTTGEDLEEARANVEMLLEDRPGWSDWHCASGDGSFAGRWEGEFFGEDNKFDALRYSDNPELAEQVIATQLEKRMREIEELREKLADFSLLTLEYDPMKRQENVIDIFRWEQLAKLLNNEWCPECYIFDLEHHSAGMRFFQARAAETPEDQWLIAVDFHF